MRNTRCFTDLIAISAVLATIFFRADICAVAQERVLYDFDVNKYGASPLYGDLITDQNGNLYGTASAGGPTNHTGTVFELVKPATGTKWGKPHVLWSFSDSDDSKGGTEPYAGLVFDSSHTNLYGTTYDGGTYGSGTVFELSPPTGGKTSWTHTVLHNFNNTNGVDGYNTYASLVLDAAGNLYGTTFRGGAHGAGIVFELVKPTTGTVWKEKILHAFSNQPTDGANPEAGLIFDASGNLYGTTHYGDTTGLYNAGTVFELSPNGSGSWKEAVLWSFSNNGEDGSEPGYGSLIFDASGNLYGTTIGGGSNYVGTVFELSPNGSGGWNETLLHDFGGSLDGVMPYAGVILDSSGNLYGTTLQGGAYAVDGNAGYGTVFELSPPATGETIWTSKVLHSFDNNGVDGFEPYAGLVLDDGSLYGLTPGGGTYSYGTVFEVTP
jgi:uncharacterized repeat protein (TIGR03803 family)